MSKLIEIYNLYMAFECSNNIHGSDVFCEDIPYSYSMVDGSLVSCRFEASLEDYNNSI